MTWQDVALHALNVVQIVALTALSVWAATLRRETKEIHREVERINGELSSAIAQATSSRTTSERRAPDAS